MSIDKDWVPGFGEIVTWYAMDKAGALAIMVNNCFGRLPKVLLGVSDLEQKLDNLSEYIWEESDKFPKLAQNKNGRTILDQYSAYSYRHLTSRAEVESWVAKRSLPTSRLTEYSLPAIKGFYIYHGVEGNVPGEDYPVGHQGESDMGDYFRYLMPSVKGGMHEIPELLRGVITVCETLEFSELAFVSGDLVDEYFCKLYDLPNS